MSDSHGQKTEAPLPSFTVAPENAYSPAKQVPVTSVQYNLSNNPSGNTDEQREIHKATTPGTFSTVAYPKTTITNLQRIGREVKAPPAAVQLQEAHEKIRILADIIPLSMDIKDLTYNASVALKQSLSDATKRLLEITEENVTLALENATNEPSASTWELLQKTKEAYVLAVEQAEQEAATLQAEAEEKAKEAQEKAEAETQEKERVLKNLSVLTADIASLQARLIALQSSTLPPTDLTPLTTLDGEAYTLVSAIRSTPRQEELEKLEKLITDWRKAVTEAEAKVVLPVKPPEAYKEINTISLEVEGELERAHKLLDGLSDAHRKKEFEEKIIELKQKFAALRATPTVTELEAFKKIFDHFKTKAAEVKTFVENNPKKAFTQEDVWKGWDPRFKNKEENKNLYSLFAEYRSFIREPEKRGELDEFEELLETKKRIGKFLENASTAQKALTEANRFRELLREAKEAWKEKKEKEKDENGASIAAPEQKRMLRKKFDALVKQLSELEKSIDTIFSDITADYRTALVRELTKAREAKTPLIQKRDTDSLATDEVKDLEEMITGLTALTESASKSYKINTRDGNIITRIPESTLEEKLASHQQSVTDAKRSKEEKEAQTQEEMVYSFEDMYERDPEAFINLYLTSKENKDDDTITYYKNQTFLRHPHKEALHFFFVQKGIVPQDPPKLRPTQTSVDKYRLVYTPGKKIMVLTKEEKEAIAQEKLASYIPKEEPIPEGKEVFYTTVESTKPQGKDMTSGGAGKEAMAKTYEMDGEKPESYIQKKLKSVKALLDARTTHLPQVPAWMLYGAPLALALIGGGGAAVYAYHQKAGALNAQATPSTPTTTAPIPVVQPLQPTLEDTGRPVWTKNVLETKMDTTRSGLSAETTTRYAGHWHEDIKSPSPMELLKTYAPVFCAKWNNPAEACNWALDTILSDYDANGNYLGNMHNLQEYQRAELSFLIKTLQSTSMATSGQPLQAKKLSDAILEVRGKVLEFEKRSTT